MALLGESRKSFGKLVRDAANQFAAALSFHFRLWQEILPDDTYVDLRIAPPETTPRTESSNLWDRLFTPQEINGVGQPVQNQKRAVPISREHISGFYDVTIDVNPDAQFDQQVLMSLYQITAPAIAEYPLGARSMLKRLWAIFNQQGFDDIYPEELAMLQTQQRLMAIQVQIATFEAQLGQLDQAAAQQQLQQLQTIGQQAAEQMGLTPEAAQAILAGQQNGTTVPIG
jgi:hypothetical protein